MATTPLDHDDRIHPTKRLFEKVAGLNGKERIELFKSVVQKNLRDYKQASFTVREGDVFVVTFPKCGTTWTQQIAKLIRNRGREDGVDVDGAFPWLELMSPEEADAMPSPRGFKSHLPYNQVPGGEPHTTAAKYISVYRNPKDAAVSAFHQYSNFFAPEMSWDEYFELFLSPKTPGPPGKCLEYFLEWWKHKDCDNVLVIGFEWMKENHREAVETIAKFMGQDVTPSEVSSIVEQTTFQAMKTNPAANMKWAETLFHDRSASFMRKGTVGDWRNYFSEEQSVRLDEEVKKTLGGTGLEFAYS